MLNEWFTLKNSQRNVVAGSMSIAIVLDLQKMCNTGVQGCGFIKKRV